MRISKRIFQQNLISEYIILLTCSHIWHVNISKCVYWLDIHSVKVWWRYCFFRKLQTNCLHSFTKSNPKRDKHNILLFSFQNLCISKRKKSANLLKIWPQIYFNRNFWVLTLKLLFFEVFRRVKISHPNDEEKWELRKSFMQFSCFYTAGH